MKTLLYTLTILLTISSCRTLEKMVDKGEYDEAIIFATQKLAGKKHKKTKHVQGLEEAFMRINTRDLDRIAYLDGPSNPQNWEAIHDIADAIHHRQRKITPFLPLISKEGYEANFDMVDTYLIKRNAQNGAAAYYYREANTMLQDAKTQKNKSYARRAYRELERVDDIIENYKDTPTLMREAKELGIVHIKVNISNASNAYLPSGLEQDLAAMNVSRNNSTWRKYYIGSTRGITYDYNATLELSTIDVSPERETIRHHTDEKRVKDGWTYKKGKDGRPAKDTLGKKIKVDKFKTVYADVSEIHREKSAYVKGYMRYFDNTTKEVKASYPLSVEAHFNDYASSYTGDRRAVCSKDHNRLKPYPLHFPDDISMIADATDKLKIEFMRAMKDVSL